MKGHHRRADAVAPYLDFTQTARRIGHAGRSGRLRIQIDAAGKRIARAIGRAVSEATDDIGVIAAILSVEQVR